MALVRCPHCGASVNLEGENGQCPSCLAIISADGTSQGGGFQGGGTEPTRGKDPFEPTSVDGRRVDEPIRTDDVGGGFRGGYEPRGTDGGYEPRSTGGGYGGDGAFKPAGSGDQGSGLIGFLLVFFLSLLGLIIALCMRKKKTTKVALITFAVEMILYVLFYVVYVVVLKGKIAA